VVYGSSDGTADRSYESAFPQRGPLPSWPTIDGEKKKKKKKKKKK
jgi:hypothetical protein